MFATSACRFLCARLRLYTARGLYPVECITVDGILVSTVVNHDGPEIMLLQSNTNLVKIIIVPDLR